MLFKGYIYAIGNRDHGWVKIGRTRDVQSRLNHLQTSNPAKLEILLVAITDHMIAVEKRLHEILEDLRAEGEWFKLDMQRIQDAFARLGLDPLPSIPNPMDNNRPRQIGAAKIYRRHKKGCAHQQERYSSRCGCPLWVQKQVNGKQIKKSLNTSVWSKAEADVLRATEAPLVASKRQDEFS